MLTELCQFSVRLNRNEGTFMFSYVKQNGTGRLQIDHLLIHNSNGDHTCRRIKHNTGHQTSLSELVKQIVEFEGKEGHPLKPAPSTKCKFANIKPYIDGDDNE